MIVALFCGSVVLYNASETEKSGRLSRSQCLPTASVLPLK